MPQYFNLPGLSTQLTVNTAQASRSLWNFGQQITTFERQMQHMGVALTFGLSLPLQVLLGASAKAFIELENAAVRTTSRISGAGMEVAKNIQRAVTQMSFQIAQTPLEIGESLDQITKMGGNLFFAEKMTPEFAKFAKVLDVDVREATDVTIRAWTTLGLVGKSTAEDISLLSRMMNDIVIVQESTGWDAKETLEAWQHGAGAAKQFGMSIKDLAISLMMLGRAGKESREAGTSLTMILSSFSTAQARHKKEFQNVFGKNLAQNWSKIDPMERLKLIHSRISQYTEAGANQALGTMDIGRKQLSHILPFLDQLSAIDDLGAKLDAANPMQERFTKLMKSSANQLSILLNHFRALSLELGEKLISPLMNMGNAFLFIASGIAKFTPSWLLLVGAFVGPGLVITTSLISMSRWIWGAGGLGAGLGYLVTGFSYLRAAMVLPTGVLLANTFASIATSARSAWAAIVGLKSALLGLKLFSGVGTLLASLGPLAASVKLLRNLGRIIGATQLTMAMSMGGGPKTWAGLGTGLWNTLPQILSKLPFSVVASGAIALTAAFVGLGLVMYKLSTHTRTEADQKRALATSNANLHGRLIAGTKQPQFWSPDSMGQLPKEFASSVFGDTNSYYVPTERRLKVAADLTDMLNKEMVDPARSVASKIEELSQAYIKFHLITKEEYDDARGLLNTSGFPPSGEGEAGDEEFKKKDKHARPARYFSAKSKGTSEEYRERIMGQQALVSVADTGLSVAKSTALHTKQTAAHTKEIRDKIPALRPSNIGKK